MLKNKNRSYSPAYPTMERIFQNTGQIAGEAGMTLRARFSSELLQTVMITKPHLQPMKQVRYAIRMANSLIKELNKLSSKDESPSKV